MFAPSPFSRRAFTLIELLVVIAILAILMTLLFPAVQGAFDAVKKTQAKNDATQLAAAVTGYLTEYGKLPTAAAGDKEINGDAALVNTLSGQDAAMNPRKIVFLEVPSSKARKSGADAGAGGGLFTSGFRDPWGNFYQVWVDGDYDNVIKTPALGDIRKTVLVWSTGKPNGTAPNTEVKKFIKSWE